MEDNKQYKIIGVFLTIIGVLWLSFEYLFVNKLVSFGAAEGLVTDVFYGSRKVEYVLRSLPVFGSILSSRLVYPNISKEKRQMMRENQIYFKLTSVFLGAIVLVGWLHLGAYNLIFYPIVVVFFFYSVSKGWVNLGSNKKEDAYFKKVPKGKEQTPLMLKMETDKGVMEIPHPNTGILTYGSQGSGKSASWAEPVIYQTVNKGWANFIYDFKGRDGAPLTNATYQSYLQLKDSAAQGRFDGVVPDFININFADLRYLSHFPNPVAVRYLKDYASCQNLMDAFYKNLNPEFIKKTDFWYSNAINIAANTLWFLRNHFPEMCTLPHLVTLILQPIDKLLELLSLDDSIKMNMAPIISAWENEAGGQLAGAQASAQLPLASLNTQELFWAFSGDEVEFKINNPSKPTIICVANLEGSQVYTPLIGIIFEIVKMQINDNDNYHPSYLCLDELPTAYFKDLDAIPATMRSKNVVLHILFQEEKQLIDTYGRDKGGKLQNMGNQVYMKLNDPQSAERVSKVFGKKKVVEINNSYNESGGSQSESTQKTERLPGSDFLNFEVGDAAGRIFDAKPSAFKLKMADKRIHKIVGCEKEDLGKLPKFGLDRLPSLENEDDTQKLLETLMKANYMKVHEDVKWMIENYVPVVKEEDEIV